MKKRGIYLVLNGFLFLLMVVWVASFGFADNGQRRGLFANKEQPEPEVLKTLTEQEGYGITITFEKGKSHNYPLMAFWIEDENGNYVEDLYVAESIAKGYFGYGDASAGHWEPGPLRRPAALPYWGHKRGVKANDGYYFPTQQDPLPDAVTGATPNRDFVLQTRSSERFQQKFHILMEINQSWDWNNYWHNNKFPDDDEYKTSSQPALVYQTTIDPAHPEKEYEMTVVGHSHWSGKNGKLYEDLSTITTAMDITKRVVVNLDMGNK
ncbi:MAG: hypothetical protein ACOC2E_01220 [Bacteroidota bacterium]